MTGYTPIYNLPYPQASDLVSAYPGTGQDLAEEVETVLAAKAALASPALTGTPTVNGVAIGWAVLASGNLSGTEVSLTSLSQAYRDLRIEVYGAVASAGSNYLGIRFNSVSTNSYEGVAINSLGTTVTNVASNANLQPMYGGEFVPTSAGTYSVVVDVREYTTTPTRKFISGMWNQSDNVWIGGHNFNNTDAITSVQIRLTNGGTFTGGNYVVRGIR